MYYNDGYTKINDQSSEIRPCDRANAYSLNRYLYVRVEILFLRNLTVNLGFRKKFTMLPLFYGFYTTMILFYSRKDKVWVSVQRR